jgi:hypothetical protein
VITPDNDVIIGCDTNVRLGIAENSEETKYMGQFANNGRSKPGVGENRLRELLLSLDLRAANTDFKHKEYDTWTSFTSADASAQTDYFFIKNTKRMKRAVLDAKTLHKVGIDAAMMSMRLLARQEPSTSVGPCPPSSTRSSQSRRLRQPGENP